MLDTTPVANPPEEALAPRAPYVRPVVESSFQTLTTLLASGACEGCDPLAEPDPTPESC
jgi:hypothetical protein